MKGRIKIPKIVALVSLVQHSGNPLILNLVQTNIFLRIFHYNLQFPNYLFVLSYENFLEEYFMFLIFFLLFLIGESTNPTLFLGECVSPIREDLILMEI